jgi:hypothetical protein
MKIAIRSKRGNSGAKNLTIIPPQILAAAGRALYGSHWQSPLAKALKVHDQLMRRWTNDGCPASHASSLGRLLHDRAQEVSDVLMRVSAFDVDGLHDGSAEKL